MIGDMVRVVIPFHLRNLAHVDGDVLLDLAAVGGEPITIKRVLDALEDRHPMLRGTIRDHGSLQRRPFIRFFVCGKDWSHDPHDKLLPIEVTEGREPFMVIGAIAGG